MTVEVVTKHRPGLSGMTADHPRTVLGLTVQGETMRPVEIATWGDVPDRRPIGALVGSVDLVVVRADDEPSVLYGRCLHRRALALTQGLDNDDPALLEIAADALLV